MSTSPESGQEKRRAFHERAELVELESDGRGDVLGRELPRSGDLVCRGTERIGGPSKLAGLGATGAPTPTALQTSAASSALALPTLARTCRRGDRNSD